MQMATRRDDIIFVGQCPSRPSRHTHALTGRCGARLGGLLGISTLQFAKTHRRVNLCKTPEWNDAEAVENAARIVRSGRKAILLGRKVQQIFGARAVDVVGEVRYGEQLFLCMPHPSGRCRFWNSKSNREKAATALRAFLNK